MKASVINDQRERNAASTAIDTTGVLGTMDYFPFLVRYCRRGTVTINDRGMLGLTPEQRRRSIELLRLNEVTLILESEYRTLAPEDLWELENRDLPSIS